MDKQNLRRLRRLKIELFSQIGVSVFLFFVPVFLVWLKGYVVSRNLEHVYRARDNPGLFYGGSALWLVPGFWIIVRASMRYRRQKADLM
jgi:hypothetical protein